MDDWKNDLDSDSISKNEQNLESSNIDELASTVGQAYEEFYKQNPINEPESNVIEWESSLQLDAEKQEVKPPTLVQKLKAKKGIWGVIGLILAGLAKFKFAIILLLGKLKYIFVLLKFSKFLGTAISMFVAIYVYSLVYGWSFGIGFVLLILTHELGHMMMARFSNVKVASPIFIPFVGAFIALKEEPKDAVTEAKIAIGGPAFGTLISLACLLMFFATGQGLYLALTYTGFMLNLFNLIPIHPIDGGRIVSAISPKIWYVGIPIMAVMIFKFPNPFIIIFFIMGIIKAYEHYKSGQRDYFSIPYTTKLIFGFLYFGLVLILSIGMYEIHKIFLIS